VKSNKHLVTVVEPHVVKDILLAIDSSQDTLVVQSALKLANQSVAILKAL